MFALAEGGREVETAIGAVYGRLLMLALSLMLTGLDIVAGAGVEESAGDDAIVVVSRLGDKLLVGLLERLEGGGGM